jgi:glycosyltransferase involved in cell wall biosynthesis
VICPKDDFEIVDALDSCRVLLLTSDDEGFALPPLEAMARGLPCVLFECGGPRVYCLDGFNGRIVHGENIELACDYICKILDDDYLYATMSNNAISTAINYNMDDGIKGASRFILSYFNGQLSGRIQNR